MSLESALDALPPLAFDPTLGLPPEADDADPYGLFAAWYRTAAASGLSHPDAMALATSDGRGRPSVRMVLLKGLDDGFVFFTNYQSRKARELEANPRASLCFHWAALERQIRVEGTVERTTEAESLAYFASRPRGSRLGAWASEQSRELATRAALESRMEEVRARYEGGDVPLPPFWGGYRVLPEAIEFWQGQASRLHDRLVFRREADAWRTARLHP